MCNTIFYIFHTSSPCANLWFCTGCIKNLDTDSLKRKARVSCRQSAFAIVAICQGGFAVADSSLDMITFLPPLLESISPDAASHTETVTLPLHKVAHEVTYTNEDGLLLFEGDVVLGVNGRLSLEAPEPHPTPRDFREFGTVGSEKHGVGSIMQEIVVRQSAGIVDRNWLWKNGIIPYKIGPWFSGAEKGVIRRAIQTLNASTNLNVVTTWDTAQKRIVFKKRNGQSAQGSSRVGRNRVLRQRIRLRSGFDERTVIHEILHAAGMWHEHSRRDRDLYIQVNYQNMDSSIRSNFEIHDTDAEIVTPYDTNSIMHYDGFAGSNNRQPTIVNRSSGAPVRESRTLSAYDIDGINTVYPVDYFNSEMSRTPTLARTVKVEVLQVVSKDLDGPGDENEFYVKSEIGQDFVWRPGNSTNSTRRQISGKHRTSHLEVRPGWVQSHLIDRNEPYAKAWLQLREDDGLPGNERKDDTFNINPFGGINEIELKIDTINGQIYLGDIDGVFDPSNYVGDLGVPIELEGFEGEFKAYIVLMITIV